MTDGDLLATILERYALSRDGIHGIAHWARVLENGRRLAAATGADLRVVELFALFHDSCRLNDHRDPDHGSRGAELARTLRGAAFEAEDRQMELLCRACDLHTRGLIVADVTIQACWDADRLDLGRVGIRPRPECLCTPAARGADLLSWADGRARERRVPDLVREEWGRDRA
jgi:uncharacterized protein